MTRNSSQKNPFPMWLASIAVWISILILVPLARPIQNAVKNNLGTGFFIIFTLVFIPIALWLFYVHVVRQRSDRLMRIFLFFLLGSISAWRILSLDVDVERFHLLEYGVLAAFVTLACIRHQMGYVSAGWGFLSAFFAGISDEYYQFLTPDRYGEFRDVVINLEGGILGILILVLIIQPTGFRSMSTRIQWSALCLACSAVSIISGLFFLRVQVFGHEIVDREAGKFKSFFQADDLLSFNFYEYIALLNRMKHPESVNPEHAARHHWYEREGREHFERVKFLVQSKDIEAAARELIIARKYFSAYRLQTQREWDTEILQLLTTTPMDPHRHFESSICNFMIVHTDRDDVKWITIGFAVFFLAAAFFLMLHGRFTMRRFFSASPC